MALGTFVAGRYSSSYTPPGGAPGDLGLVERGYEIAVTYSKELIQDTDAYADAVIDGVTRGGNAFVGATCKEYKSGVLQSVLPYHAMLPSGVSSLGPGMPVGRLDSNIAGTIVFSATSGTPAAASPASLTGPFAILAENFDIRWLYGPTHRLTPFRFRFLPSFVNSVLVWFTTA